LLVELFYWEFLYLNSLKRLVYSFLFVCVLA
jgi:hypothetical protein